MLCSVRSLDWNLFLACRSLRWSSCGNWWWIGSSHHPFEEGRMRQDRRQCEIQMGLSQPRLERPEWKALPIKTKQTVLSLLIELLQEAAVAQTAPKAQGRGDD